MRTTTGCYLKEIFRKARVTSGDWEAGTYLFFSQFAVPVVCVSPLLAAGFPPHIIMVSFLPAFVWQHIVGLLYGAVCGVRLTVQEERTDVTALPGLGADLVSSLTITLGVMLPLWTATGDPYRTWGVGLAVNLLFGAAKLLCVPFAGALQRVVPRAALLGLLGGLLLIYVGTTYGISLVQEPYVAFFALAVVLATRLGGWLERIPVIPVIFAVGSVIGYMAGYSGVPATVGGMSLNFGTVTTLGFRHLPEAFVQHTSLLVPLALGNQLLRNLSNLEAAEAMGDRYPARELLLFDAAVTTVGGAFLGSWMPTFLLAGHPGWKQSGAGVAYPALAAAGFLLTGFSGLLWLARGIIPDGAVAGIFIWLALAVGDASVRETPRRHLPALLLAFIPIGAHLVLTQVEGLVGANAAQSHVSILARGFPFTAIVWSSVAVHLLDGQALRAAAWGVGGAALSFFGFMHSARLGVGVGPSGMTVGYLIWAAVTLALWLLDRWCGRDAE